MNSQEPFKREYGFLYIITPEDKAKYSPKQDGDEYWRAPKWNSIGAACGKENCEACHTFMEATTYRRPISPGPDHEIVPLDGVPDDYGCEMFCRGEWEPFANRSKQTVEAWIKSIPAILAIRRPISKPVESGWVSVKERLPEPYQQVVAIPPSTHDAKDGLLVSLESYNNTNYRWVKVITHWMPIPPAPQPPRPAAEVAFEIWLGVQSNTLSLGDTAELKTAWRAAIDWAKSHKGEL